MSKSVSEEYVALMQSQLTTGPQPGERWKHYKGGEYEIVCRSVDEATLVQLVTYRSVLKGFTWTRNLTDFMSLVPRPYGQTTERFSRISEASNLSNESQSVSTVTNIPPDSTGCPEKPSGAHERHHGSPTVGVPCRSLQGIPQCHECQTWFTHIHGYSPGAEPMMVGSQVLCRSCYNDKYPYVRPLIER